MKPPLTPEEKRLIEREFIAREERRGKRRAYFARVFWVGLAAEVGFAFLHAFRLAGPWSLLLGIAGMVCVLLYTGFLPVPRTFAEDLSAGWHLNPWRDTLLRLSAEDRHVRGIILLVAYPLSRAAFELIALSVR